MIEILEVFFLTAIISFIGSFQLGPLVILILHSSLKFNIKGGLTAGFGGILPEFIYSLMALIGFGFLKQNEPLLYIIELMVVPIFLLLGIVNYFSKPKDISTTQVELKSIFKKGFLYSMLNPMILVFWIVALVFMQKHVPVITLGQKLSFMLASGVGAFAIFVIVTLFAIKYKSKVFIMFNKYPFNKILGLVFIGVALIQVIKLFFR